jgi:hypothetical protein
MRVIPTVNVEEYGDNITDGKGTARRDGLPAGRDGQPAGRDVSTHTSEVPTGTGRGRMGGVRFGTSVPVTGLTVIHNHHGGSLEISIFL